MYHYRNDTLAHYKAGVLFQPRNIGGQPLKALAEQVKAYNASQHGQVKPETEALRFYLMNHAFAMLSQNVSLHEPMHPDMQGVADLYMKEAAMIMRRVFYYITLITIREARHMHSPEKFTKEKLGPKFGEEVAKRFESLRSKMQDSSSTAGPTFVNHCPEITVGQYFACLSEGFHKGSYSGGYGGHPWGNVADCALHMVTGKTSPEIMVDLSWALAHNNGPIFNKGMYYEVYNSQSLLRILDVQRGGQIPQLIASEPQLNGNTDYVKMLWNRVHKVFPQACEGAVDWHKVQEAGAVGHYVSGSKPKPKAPSMPKKKAEEALNLGTLGTDTQEKFYVGIHSHEFVLKKKRIKVAA